MGDGGGGWGGRESGAERVSGGRGDWRDACVYYRVQTGRRRPIAMGQRMEREGGRPDDENE